MCADVVFVVRAQGPVQVKKARAKKARDNLARERAEASAAAAATAATSPSKKISDDEQYVQIEDWPAMVTLQPCCCELILCTCRLQRKLMMFLQVSPLLKSFQNKLV